MSDTTDASQMFGVFLPGKIVEIDGFEFERVREWTSPISVFDLDHEGDLVGHAPAEIKTEAEARMWLDGFRAGEKQGEKRGREVMQRDLRILLGIRG